MPIGHLAQSSTRFAHAVAKQIDQVNLAPLMSIRQLNDVIFRHVEAQNPTKIIKRNPEISHPPSASASACIIPLEQDPRIRINYHGKNKLIRFGKILEDLDTFAVWLAYKHNQGPEVEMGTPNHPPFHAVTACVDKIDLQNRTIRSDLDIVMTGMVTWVGRSSMEITMHLSQKYSDDDYRDVLTARFVMVTLEPNGRKAVPNVPLALETEEDKVGFQKAEHARQVRIHREEMSLFKNPPTEIERAMLHDLFLQSIQNKNMSRKLPENYRWMKDAKLENLVVCFPIKRNMYGKIFGGYLMRSAFETAFANAAIFSKCRPEVMAVDSVVFKKGVEIGSLLLLNAQVSYSTDCFMQMAVDAQVVDVESGERETTNTFQFTFRADKPVPLVMPESYSDGMNYLTGRRHFNSSAHW
ncbi:unnamed protein product [Bursaphelenchus xylophilus]|uniref:(pine wood nematode) hypothetical protein n=1 Tax=Bursaphelenchus xylophilus TaxID=6326 RepID=A0A1I7SER3_BURXY|nr:unnamed protein product [Bursaphelenchus xylophilus]CAG9128282.1 unnamed protein product [Bursaphelenchus xylophilus]